MTLEEQRAHIVDFFHAAHLSFTRDGLKLVMLKGPDYAPERIPMTDAFFAAAELNVDVPHILWVHCRKHMSAISRYMAKGRLNSEDVRSRLLDVANYMALIDSYVTDPWEWLTHLEELIKLNEFPDRSPEEMTVLGRWVKHQKHLVRPRTGYHEND